MTDTCPSNRKKENNILKYTPSPETLAGMKREALTWIKFLKPHTKLITFSVGVYSMVWISFTLMHLGKESLISSGVSVDVLNLYLGSVSLIVGAGMFVFMIGIAMLKCAKIVLFEPPTAPKRIAIEEKE